jgi:hypothetical protein
LATSRSEADDIRLQMAKIRSALHQDVLEVVDGASAATDVRAYLRKSPWLAIGLAFVSGYVLVPRGRKPSVATVIMPPPPPTSAETFVQPVEPERRSWGILRPMIWTLGALWPIALRIGQSYAVNYVDALLANNPPGPTGPPPSGGGKPWPEPTDQPRRTEGRAGSLRGF